MSTEQHDADAYGQELARISHHQHEATDARFTVFQALAAAGIGHEQADDIVATLEAGAVAGAHTWISESSPPHKSEPRFEDGWFAGVRDVAPAVAGGISGFLSPERIEELSKIRRAGSGRRAPPGPVGRAQFKVSCGDGGAALCRPVSRCFEEGIGHVHGEPVLRRRQGGGANVQRRRARQYLPG
ncbi:hypothetical protein [Streptomyces sp. AM6-12]|uniref:hypothetical protein n=1 Tax=Streptomyces sp. AM6-12 TaxID=3345149 RepID=UPI0037B77B9F